jgi:hypothetical protein
MNQVSQWDKLMLFFSPPRCYEDKMTQQILAKVENVTGIPEKNYEFFQLLKYEVGECMPITSSIIRRIIPLVLTSA